MALYLDLDYPAAFLRRGSINGELGEYEKAISDFNEVIESNEQDASTYHADAYYKRGIAYLNLGENQKAIDDFNQAIKRDSNYREVYYYRGMANENLGKYEEANKDYSQAYSKSLLVYDLTGHSGMFAAVRSVTISPDGRTLASGSDDSTIKLWNLNTGQEINTISGHSDWVRACTLALIVKLLPVPVMTKQLSCGKSKQAKKFAPSLVIHKTLLPLLSVPMDKPLPVVVMTKPLNCGM